MKLLYVIVSLAALTALVCGKETRVPFVEVVILRMYRMHNVIEWYNFEMKNMCKALKCLYVRWVDVEKEPFVVIKFSVF